MSKSFYDLNIYKKGFDLIMQIYKITSGYPKDERFGLVDQTRRAANSVIAIIAEAHGRYYYADKIRVLYQSRGEVEEVRSHLMVAHGLGSISNDLFGHLNDEYQDLGMSISAFIKYLEDRKPNSPINESTN